MNSAPYYQKSCVTCTFWLAERTPENRQSDGTFAYVKYPARSGQCAKLKCVMNDSSICQNYLKWPILKSD